MPVLGVSPPKLARSGSCSISSYSSLGRAFARGRPCCLVQLPHRAAGVSSSSPVAIRITLTALLITSAGRFWPRGPGHLDSIFAWR